MEDGYLVSGHFRRRDNPNTHVVMLVDFDGKIEKRTADFEQAVPGLFKARVFVVGSKYTPEILKNQVKKSFEEIGTCLADDCDAGTALWGPRTTQP